MTPQKKKQVITGILMTTAMAGALSGFFSMINTGFTSQMPAVWLKNFLMGWPVGFAVSAIVGGPVQRLAEHLAGFPKAAGAPRSQE